MPDADAHEPPVTPLPIPAGARSALLVGGSFDPPTLAHARIAQLARERALSPDAWLLFVPAARSPFKPDPPAPDHHRVAMLRALVADLDRAAVWTDELDRAAVGAPSYWIDTLRRANRDRPDLDLAFLIGADQAAEFHRWRDARAILALARPLVAPRAPFASPDAILAHLTHTGAWNTAELDAWRAAVLELPLLPASATRAREALAADPPDEQTLAELLHPAVLAYIRAHHLYTA